MWEKQWSLTSEELQAVGQLVQNQLNAQHIKALTSFWNFPLFFIENKFGKWELLADLRAINKVSHPTDFLQPRIPLPSLLPKGWYIIVIGLKDCFLLCFYK